MDNEIKQMFELVIKKLDKIEKDQVEMKAQQDEMKAQQDEMKAQQDEMKAQQDKMKGQQDEMKGQQDIINDRLSNMEVRQDEIFQVVKAIEHSNTVHKSEIDNLTYKVAHTQGTINKIGDVIEQSRAIK